MYGREYLEHCEIDECRAVMLAAGRSWYSDEVISAAVDRLTAAYSSASTRERQAARIQSAQSLARPFGYQGEWPPRPGSVYEVPRRSGLFGGAFGL